MVVMIESRITVCTDKEAHAVLHKLQEGEVLRGHFDKELK